MSRVNLTGSWKAPGDSRAYPLCKRNRHALPGPDGDAITRIIRIQLQRRFASSIPVIPIQRDDTRVPLLLEYVGPGADGRAAEIENLIALLTRKTEHLPEQEHIGAEIHCPGRRGAPVCLHGAAP